MYLVDFIILDFEVDEVIPIILGRRLLATGKTLDVQNSEWQVHHFQYLESFEVPRCKTRGILTNQIYGLTGAKQ